MRYICAFLLFQSDFLETALHLRDGKEYLVTEQVLLRFIEFIQKQIENPKVIDFRSVVLKALQMMVVRGPYK